MLPGQLDSRFPERLRQLRPYRSRAAELLQLALQLHNGFGNRQCAFAVHVRSRPLATECELSRMNYGASRILTGNSPSHGRSTPTIKALKQTLKIKTFVGT